VVLFFDEDSPDPNIKLAMRAARRMRKELREIEAIQASAAPSSAGPSRGFDGRDMPVGREDD
jgi:hypothetical protein